MLKLMQRLAGLLAALVLAAVSFGASAGPLSDAAAAKVSAAIEKNWNIPTGIPDLESYTLMLRLYMTQGGVVTKIEVLDDNGDPGFRTLAESARRAILITQKEDGRLPIPPDEYNPTIILRWQMKLICEQAGGC